MNNSFMPGLDLVVPFNSCTCLRKAGRLAGIGVHSRPFRLFEGCNKVVVAYATLVNPFVSLGPIANPANQIPSPAVGSGILVAFMSHIFETRVILSCGRVGYVCGHVSARGPRDSA